MIEQQMKIGPKGQVVIPKAFRKFLGIYPGSDVVFELKKEGILIEKQATNVVEIFDRIARSGKLKTFEQDKQYEEEIEHRWRKVKK
ncbi:MAG: AbrB/MazE/SpoVT family DNA-binding domain-containing protein [Candidatus Altiarchaeales archaeon HGW-Altiarchaeales-1]|nr:MAG: AbrB/MazE/SpoVT family DNA-binding domain-containing protein [Candidatus Altiarchaeales archaeon HGW-Altiarchaeales-1]